MNYLYDAFLSYKSEDRAWADRLRQKLESKGLKVYQDLQLRGGDKWLPQLQDALEASRHLLVLWSVNANQSAGWVAKEMFHFEYKCRQLATPEQPRRMIAILLDADKPPITFADLHARADLQQGGARLDDVNSPPPRVWDELIVKLYGDLTHLPTHRLVRSVILASTRTYFESTDLSVSHGFGALDGVLAQLGLKLADTAVPAAYAPFLARYGQSREEWLPFGADGLTVENMLNDVELDVNQSLAHANHTPIRLVPVDQSFWSDDVVAVENITRELANSHTLVVIDPLSLYDENVRARVDRLRDCFSSNGVAVVMLGPFGLGARGPAISGHVRAMAQDLYRHFFDPVLPLPVNLSASAANISDLSQIKRYLLLALGRANPLPPSPSQIAFISH